jgi:hypothetical protein
MDPYNMIQHTDQELIEAYLDYYRTKNEEFWWAWEEADKKRSSDDLEFVFKLIQACRDDSEIAYVAAGPLKDLFIAQHLVIKKKLSVMVRQHKSIRKAIQAFILPPGTPERKTLDEILNKYGLHHASL